MQRGRETSRNGMVDEEDEEEEVTSRSGRPLRRRCCTFGNVLDDPSRRKRHVLQGMARPLKRWLVRHRENPYPTKAEKIALAFGSQMTLVQVSNWFANARRRLKNAVTTPGAGWATRVKMYNSCVAGNAELLSISSDDSIWDSEEDDGVDSGATSRVEVEDHCYSAAAGHTDDYAHSPNRTVAVLVSRRRRRHQMDEAEEEEEESCPPSKYKRAIMQRYLHDMLPETTAGADDGGGTGRCHSLGSSSDSGRSSGSSSPLRDVRSPGRANHPGDRIPPVTDADLRVDQLGAPSSCTRSVRSGADEDGRYWREFDAAVVLINLGRSVRCASL